MNTTITPLQSTVSLKELRGKFPQYITAIARGQSFTVLKRSKPIFQINPVDDGQTWQTIADFTRIDDQGVPADNILAQL